MSFRLASLLRVRRLQSDVAAGASAAAAARAAAAHRAAGDRRAELAGSAAPHVADQWQFRSAVAARSARSSLLTESLAFAGEQDQGAAQARAAAVTARRAVRGLELLEERHLQEQTAAQLAHEQRLLDEHAGRTAADAPHPAPGGNQR